MVDIVLIEKEAGRGLTVHEILLMVIFGSNEVLPLEIEGNHSYAMGFITVEVAEKFNYDCTSSGLGSFISSIIDDMSNENKDGIYHFEGTTILLGRNSQDIERSYHRLIMESKYNK